jgi:hypothetical protein
MRIAGREAPSPARPPRFDEEQVREVDARLQ